MIFRRYAHMGIDKTIDLPPGHPEVRFSPSGRYCTLAFVFVTILIICAAILIDIGITTFGNDDVSSKTTAIKAIDEREEEKAWGETASDILFMHDLKFSDSRLALIRQDALRSNTSPTDAYRNAAQVHKAYLTEIIAGRENTRFWLHIFCGIQLFFAWIALNYSIFTGNLIGYDLKGDRSLFLQAPLNIFEYISDQSSSLITIVGICGTFAGLTVGLSNMTSSPAGELDMQPLFISLSISFISSLSGIVTSVITRLLQKSFETPLRGAASSGENGRRDAKQAPTPSSSPTSINGGGEAETSSDNGDSFKPIPEVMIKAICGVAGDFCQKLEDTITPLSDIVQGQETLKQAIDKMPGLSESDRNELNEKISKLTKTNQDIESFAKDLRQFKDSLIPKSTEEAKEEGHAQE